MDEVNTGRFSLRDWLILAIGVALALLWREVFVLSNLEYGLPALGTVSCFSISYRGIPRWSVMDSSSAPLY